MVQGKNSTAYVDDKIAVERTWCCASEVMRQWWGYSENLLEKVVRGRRCMPGLHGTIVLASQHHVWTDQTRLVTVLIVAFFANYQFRPCPPEAGLCPGPNNHPDQVASERNPPRLRRLTNTHWI
jgi:hypothetical protein